MSYRELAEMLDAAGFRCEWGKGSHLKWWHPASRETVILKYNRPSKTTAAWVEHKVRTAIQRSKQA